MSTGHIRPPGAHTALSPATAARITDGFRAARRATNADVSIPLCTSGWRRRPGSSRTVPAIPDWSLTSTS